MTEGSVAAPALSTAQTEDVFTLEKYQNSDKDRSLYLGPSASNELDLKETIRKHYMIEPLIEWLKAHPEYKVLTLQFPDYLVMDSPIVTQLLQEELGGHQDDDHDSELDTQTECSATGMCCKNSSIETVGRKFWILADTAYSSCCVDEVASEHVNSDVVIHFGDACLNSIQKLPVVYCFGKPFIDFEAIVSKFQEAYPDHEQKVCLMANAPYTCYLKAVHQKLSAVGYQNLLYSDISLDSSDSLVDIIGYEPTDASKAVQVLDNRIIISEKDVSISDHDQLCSEYELFHITVPGDPRLLYLTTKFRSVIIYNPANHNLITGPFPSMMKRYKFMHVARTAGTIGILVNTLSLKNTKKTINRLAKLIKDSDKKHYMFVVGKPNVAKLANFEAVDVWCILGCGQNGVVLDQNNEFYKPIITPYELTMALSPDVVWTGEWIVNFEQVLNEISTEEQPSDESGNGSPDSDAPEFSAVSGQYVSTSRPLRSIQRLEIETPCESQQEVESQLVEKFSGAVAIKNTVSTSAIQLQNRQWTGLGSDFNPGNYEEDGATIEQGISGVASQYEFDKTNLKEHS